MSHPPRTGPSAVVMAVKPDHVPMARPRDDSSKVALMIARLLGTRNAAPMPWMKRAIIRYSIFEERPQATEAAANTATPLRKTKRRPRESPSAPPTRMSAERDRP